MNWKFLFVIVFLAGTNCNPHEDPVPQSGEVYFPPENGSQWETTSPENLGWHSQYLPELYRLLSENGTRAFLILKDGKIVVEKYYGKNIPGTNSFDQNSVWYWASAGKTLTAFMVGKAREDGFLDIRSKTSNYLGAGWTSLAGQQESKITVRHQLTMTTGLDDQVPNSHGTAPKDLVFKADAGTRWAYHNGPYTLLEQVVAKSTGQDFDAYFNRELRDQIGMDGFWQWLDSDHVYFSTARSMARFGLLILNKGVWRDRPIMKDNTYFTDMLTASQSLNKSYGYLWWLNGRESFMLPESQLVFSGSYAPNAPVDMVAGIGKNGQYVCVIPSLNLVMVRMGENPESVPVPFLFLDDIWEKLRMIIP